MSDSKQRAQAVAMLAETFRRDLTEALLAAYEAALSDVPGRQVMQAAVQIMRTSKFMPTPFEIRECCGDHSTEDRAVLAFAALDRATSRVGAYRSVDFDDPAINAAVRSLGGWSYVCEMTESEFQSYYRPRFLKTYAAFSRQASLGESGEPLVGITDAANGAAGHRQRKPTRIETGLMPSSVKRLETMSHERAVEQMRKEFCE